MRAIPLHPLVSPLHLTHREWVLPITIAPSAPFTSPPPPQGLESQADRDNVWHRITAMKKSASKLHPSGSRAASRGGAASGGGATSPGGGPASPGGAAAF